MERVAPSQFYTGLVAQLYAPLRSVVPEAEPYARFIGAAGEPALELGCGDGDPLLDLRERGIDVEGLDASADMLARCRTAAAARSLDVVLHHQPIETMELGKRYRSIFLAGPTFNLLVDDDTARAALHRIRAHLEPGGSALIPLFVPAPTPSKLLGRFREHRAPDGALMRFAVADDRRDEDARVQTSRVHYELVGADGETSELDRDWVLHWYGQAGFRQLAESAELTVQTVLRPDATPAQQSDTEFVFWLRR
jgi:SAM-dependent methyltransferase